MPVTEAAPAPAAVRRSRPLPVQIWTGARNLLPTGRGLSEQSWRNRHRVILMLLWAHAMVVPIFGMIRGHGVIHSLFEGGIVAALAAGASAPKLSTTVRAALSTFGLVSSSAILTHFSDGLIEMHFHFFVMVAVVTLYQSWVPFLTAIGYVLLHHGIVGALDPASVFNHPAALANPWKWASIHALFIAGESAACLTAWKLNENSNRALQESEASFRLLFESNPLPMWVYDLNTLDFLAVNDAAVQRYGYTRGEFFHMRITDVRPQGQIPLLLEDLASNREAFQPAGEWQHVTKHGDVIDVEITSHTLDFEDRRAALVVVEDITERKQSESERNRAEEVLTHRAFHDPLTGLANRALFTDRVQHGLTPRAGGDEAVAILFIDLDDFKTINDTLGHAAGDDLLVAAADRLRYCVRPSDTVARLGGDEFAVLLEENAGRFEAAAVAQRVLDALEAPFRMRDEEVMVRGSAGIAIGRVGRDRVDELLRNADTAMYEAKARGRARYEIFEEHMQAALVSRLQFASELKEAVQNESFELVYQPFVELRTGRMLGVEALIRWEHPERGLVAPQQLIPVAEQMGLIAEIDRWVLRNAVTQAEAWAARHPGLQMSVNLSARTFHQDGLIEEVTGVVRDAGLDPQNLIVEITESVLLKDTDATVRKLRELRDAGIRLAIDDYGTGHSSLSYLKEFPIDVLKIDRSFIERMGAGPEEAALAHAMVRLGQTLDLQVLAEGVEFPEQVARLQEMGCTFGQGSFFSSPVDPAGIESLFVAAEEPPWVSAGSAFSYA